MSATILITGASSGIGHALAVHYARDGARLALAGRDSERLEAVARECRDLGAEVSVAVIDVRQRGEMFDWIRSVDRATPIDIVIANAGTMAGTTTDGEVEPADAAYAVIETNVLGVLNTVQPLLPAMMTRGKGQIAIISSVAAFIPLPDCPSYSASKAAVLNYGLSLRALLAPNGIGVSVICPGYITTPMMLREVGPKPFKMQPDDAARIIARGLQRNRSVIAFPFLFALATRLHGLLPDPLRRWITQGSRFTVLD